MNRGAVHTVVHIDGVDYDVKVVRNVTASPTAPRLVVVAHIESDAAREVLRVCLDTVQRFTPEEHELWVVDNNSPEACTDWLSYRPEINLALSRTEPLPPEARGPIHGEGRASQKQWGSYANAVGLELGARLIDPDSHYMMSLHMDTMPCAHGWLSFLRSKLDGRTRAAGVRMDTTRHPAGVLHVLGLIVDFQRFRSLNLDFFPHLPGLDVGDGVTLGLRDAGYDVFACRNTMWDTRLEGRISKSSPLRDLRVDRALDDHDRPIFLHLGRGVRKAAREPVNGTGVEDWIGFADSVLLRSPDRADRAPGTHTAGQTPFEANGGDS